MRKIFGKLIVTESYQVSAELVLIFINKLFVFANILCRFRLVFGYKPDSLCKRISCVLRHFVCKAVAFGYRKSAVCKQTLVQKNGMSFFVAALNGNLTQPHNRLFKGNKHKGIYNIKKGMHNGYAYHGSRFIQKFRAERHQAVKRGSEDYRPDNLNVNMERYNALGIFTCAEGG